jgi:hypothetical protein
METARATPTKTGYRKDSSGRRHPVASAACESCACPFEYALDEVGIIWERGSQVSRACEDETCDCHVAPIQGLRFTVRTS